MTRVVLPIKVNQIPADKRRELAIRARLKLRAAENGDLLVYTADIGRVRSWQTGSGYVVGVHAAGLTYYEIEFDEDGDFCGVSFTLDGAQALKLSNLFARAPLAAA